MRTHHRRACFLGALAACFASLAVQAQSLCDVKDTRDSCIQKYEEKARAQQAARQAQSSIGATKKTALEKSAVTNTGNANASSAVPTSAFTDFFNTMHAAADTGGGNKDDPQAMAFELNHCGVPAMPGQKIRCQIRGRLEKPQIYEPLKKALLQANLSDRESQIEDGLELSDRVTGGLFLSLVDDSYGRELTTGNNALFQKLQAEAEQADSGTVNLLRQNAGQANADYAQYLNDLAQADPRVRALAPLLVTPEFTFDKLPAELQQEALARFEAVVDKTVQYNFARSRALQAVRYFDLKNLLDNQPQPLLGVEYGATTQFAGPDELRAKISYETGFVNINSFRRYQRRICGASTDAAESASTALCLQRYLNEPGVRASLGSGNRFAFTLEHVRRKRFDVAVPDTTVSLSEAPVRSWIGSLTVGRYLDPIESESQLTRLDITASYEDVSNDPRRHDRGVASATLSRQLSGDWLINVGLVYATKPEFRAQANKDLSLRLGLNYKILRKPAG